MSTVLQLLITSTVNPKLIKTYLSISMCKIPVVVSFFVVRKFVRMGCMLFMNCDMAYLNDGVCIEALTFHVWCSSASDISTCMLYSCSHFLPEQIQT